MKKSVSVAGIFLVALALSSCAERNRPVSLLPGEYTQTSRTVDSQGTERDQESVTNVYYDANGNKRVAVDKTTSVDPKGLFNKRTTETHQVVR